MVAILNANAIKRHVHAQSENDDDATDDDGTLVQYIKTELFKYCIILHMNVKRTQCTYIYLTR